ncbi:hypothetical protein OH76DRAFT_505997 [Lentinus brumalis]|uniref:Uncharacterized protein n=1 Tax=Lentinus brumalis TaxID=2498619 RepID=A0A371CHX1_9APHY|nr:hypothetical protein OH76DRAFT_505997 [Polyporus brumalis]
MRIAVSPSAQRYICITQFRLRLNVTYAHCSASPSAQRNVSIKFYLLTLILCLWLTLICLKYIVTCPKLRAMSRDNYWIPVTCASNSYIILIELCRGERGKGKWWIKM